MVRPHLVCSGQKGFAHVLLLLAGVGVLAFLGVVYVAPFKNGQLASLFPKQFSFAATDPISNVTTNVASYPNSQVPKYEKFEATFNVETSASNKDMPYDTAPPPGVQAGIGVTVNGEFSQDNFATKFTIPAFYYQDFDYQVKSNQDWLYPKDQYAWKLRFAPNKTGDWQYRIIKTDSSGSYTSPSQTFSVSDSANKGFVRVSPKDTRYFEFEDGTYFPGLGYNMNAGQLSWDNPVVGNQANFQKMGANGIQLIRAWLSYWSIWSTYEDPWQSPVLPPSYPGFASLTVKDPANIAPNAVYPGTDASMYVKWVNETTWQNYVNGTGTWYGSPCMFLGFGTKTPAVKRNTTYHVKIHYHIPADLIGPQIAGHPYGFVMKTGGWATTTKTDPAHVWRPNQECAYPLALSNQLNPGLNMKAITPYVTANTNASVDNGWSILEADFTSPNADYMPFIYVATENVAKANDARAYINYVEIREKDATGALVGPNILQKPSMDQLKYFDQRASFAFDKVLDLAKQNNVYLKLVVLEKNEFLQSSINNLGQPAATWNNWNFYGDRNMTKVRWHQQAYWRYLQARYGYSTNVHTWEALNEGAPNDPHYVFADEFGKYMKQFKPNEHLITTSFWGSWPGTNFWRNTQYPNIDYGDIHTYIREGVDGSTQIDGVWTKYYLASEFFDAALHTPKHGKLIGAKAPFGANKPVIRGEVSFLNPSPPDGPSTEILKDKDGIWLHKFVWAEIDSGGVLNSYWDDKIHIYYKDKATGLQVDFRPIYKTYYDFIMGIPLTNGNYVEAVATATNTNLRVTGQKDLTNKRAHIWIDNKTHTWKNVIDSIAPTNVAAATVTIPGMLAGTYPVSWIDPYTNNVVKNENVTVGASGDLNLSVTNLSTDIAVKVGDYTMTASPPPTVVPSASVILKQGDVNSDGKADIFDYNTLLGNFGQQGPRSVGNLDGLGGINILDYNEMLTGFGK